MAEHPPTIFVVHPKEKRRKCSIEPLRGQKGFVHWKYPRRGEEPLENYVRLGIGGPLISEKDAHLGLLILDGTWRYAEVMERDYQDVPVRSLPDWKTAYPRVSTFYDDPSEGLATIEALFAAYVHLGRDTTGLLDEYYWADQFLELNQHWLQCDQSSSSS